MRDLSIIMLDWSVREKFHALEWLNQQTVPRWRYEIIWVELRERILPEVSYLVDVLLTLKQTQPLYRKHPGLNVGLIAAKAPVVTMCDSDAVYPPEFVESVLDSFGSRKILMHHQHRSNEQYPDGATIDEIRSRPFVQLIPNTSACTSMLRRDAIGFGGVDEHPSFDGYWSGQNELVWRIINSGVPEVWHTTVKTYHFDHPGGSGRGPSLSEIAPNSNQRDAHNILGVQAFQEGRLLPLVENPEIHRLRMEQRIIGTDFEKQYSWKKP